MDILWYSTYFPFPAWGKQKGGGSVIFFSFHSPCPSTFDSVFHPMFASPPLSTQPPFPAWIPYHFPFIRPLLFLFLFPSILYFRFLWIKTLPSFFCLLSSFSPIRLFSLKTGSFVSAYFPSYFHNTKFPEYRPFRHPSTSASFFSVSSFLPLLFFHSSTLASFSLPLHLTIELLLPFFFLSALVLHLFSYTCCLS